MGVHVHVPVRLLCMTGVGPPQPHQGPKGSSCPWCQMRKPRLEAVTPENTEVIRREEQVWDHRAEVPLVARSSQNRPHFTGKAGAPSLHDTHARLCVPAVFLLPVSVSIEDAV